MFSIFLRISVNYALIFSSAPRSHRSQMTRGHCGDIWGQGVGTEYNISLGMHCYKLSVKDCSNNYRHNYMEDVNALYFEKRHAYSIVTDEPLHTWIILFVYTAV